MKRRIIPVALLLAAAMPAHADVVVVAHPRLKVNQLPQAQVARVFLGVSNVLPDGSTVVPRAVTGTIGAQFAKEVLHKTPEQMDRYWRRMSFRGAATPVAAMDAGQVKAWVANTPGAMAYMDSSDVDSSVKIITVR